MIPMPDRIARLDRDARGYPIPFVVFRDGDRINFAVNDANAEERCVRERLCHVCGEPLGERVAFVGGPGSALLNGAVAVYHEGPVHPECARYALQVCPYLTCRMTRSVTPSAGARLAAKGIVTVDATRMAGFPTIFVALYVDAFSVRGVGPGRSYTVPKAGAKIEYWRDGAMMPLDKGRKAARVAANALARQIEVTR